jgi:hypothetical protein
MTQEGLFGVEEFLGPFPALVVCEECGAWVKAEEPAAGAEFTARHIERHGGTARIGCWRQQPDSLAAILGGELPERPASAGESASPAVTDLAAWRKGRYVPEVGA